MEILLILAVLVLAIWFFFLRTKEEQVSSAPYKVETPVATKTEEVVVTVTPEPVNDQITDSVTQAAPAPVVETTPAKKPRKPRTPKVKVEEAPKKVAVKKAAPPTKAAAMKAPLKAPRSKKS
jgi:outer membrane biosynthesis protein TonB